MQSRIELETIAASGAVVRVRERLESVSVGGVFDRDPAQVVELLLLVLVHALVPFAGPDRARRRRRRRTSSSSSPSLFASR